MQRIAQTAQGRFAKTQQDLLRIAMNQSSIQEEEFEHPICDIGFCEYREDCLERMTDDIFFKTVLSILKARPSSRLWDIVPDVPYTQDNILVKSIDAYRMSFEAKASFLASEFLRRPKMCGFKMELHDVDGSLGKSNAPASASFTIYEHSDNLEDTVIPVRITTRYRLNF